MAKRRRSHRSEQKRYDIVGKGAFTLAFLSQLVSKDLPTLNSYSAIDKGKYMVNEIVGGVTGVNVFSSVKQVSAHRNINGVFNSWTGMGLAGMAYAYINKHSKLGLPQAGMANKLGKSFFLGGVLGGFFDTPAREGAGTSQQDFGNGSYNSKTQSDGNYIG
jgi:hypothetical protein